MEDLKELDDEIIQLAKNKEHEDFMKLILYRSQRKWYATISIIFIFGLIIILMMGFMALGKDLTAGWKEVLLVMVGAFVGIVLQRGPFSLCEVHVFSHDQA